MTAPLLAPPEHGIAYPNVTRGRVARPRPGAARRRGRRRHRRRRRDGGARGCATPGSTCSCSRKARLHRTETFTTDPGDDDPAALPRRRHQHDPRQPAHHLRRGPLRRRLDGDQRRHVVAHAGARADALGARARPRRASGRAPWSRTSTQAERILHVEPNHEDTFGRNTHLFVARRANALGWPLARAPRNMRRCVGLNNCALGCPTGAKQAMHVTEVPRALAAGAALAHRRAGRPRALAGHARGRRARPAARRRRPPARAASRSARRSSCSPPGARHTPGILRRSRLRARADRPRAAHAPERQVRRHLRRAHRSLDRHAPGVPRPPLPRATAS